MSADVESARLDWADAYDRLNDASRDPGTADQIAAQLEVVLRELRKRLGATYTLGELGAEYRVAESWVREALSEYAAHPSWPRTLSMVEGAAFHLYSRGALDYDP